jgi:DASH complex subunit DAM1
MCSVVEGFLDRPGRGLRCAGSDIENSSSFADSVVTVLELVAPPDLSQARVNKCLIALVNRKIVTKDSSTVCHLSLFLILQHK